MGRDRLAVARRRSRRVRWQAAPPTGSSVQLLFADVVQMTGGRRTAHIDLGADDVEVESARPLIELGAARLGPGRGWIVLRDPVRMVFYVTSQLLTSR